MMNLYGVGAMIDGILDLVDGRLSTGPATASSIPRTFTTPDFFPEIPVAFVLERIWDLPLFHAMIPTRGHRARLMNEPVAMGLASIDPELVAFAILGKRVQRHFETTLANGERKT